MSSPDPSQMLRAALECRDERLDNGLRLIMIEDHRVPATAVNLWYNVGSRNEVAGRTGFAHLFEHLMFEGSRNAAKGEHVAAITQVGGSYNGTTSFDRTNYFETVPSRATELVLWLEADRMGGLLDTVTEENLEAQRAIVKNERRQNVDNVPCGSAGERLHHALFPKGHPYHHPVIGYMEDLDAATLEDVHAFFRSYYAPNNATLGVVGDFDPDQVRAWVEEYFGDIDPNPDIVPPRDGTLPLGLGGEIRETIPDEVGIPQVRVCYRAPAHGTPEFEALNLGCHVLGSGRASRMHKNLQRDRRLVFGAGMGMSDLYGGINTAGGGFTPVPGESIEEVEAAFHDTVLELVTKPPTDEELERAIGNIEVAVLRGMQSIAAKADHAVGNAMKFGDPLWLLPTLEQLRSITADDISKAAAEVFRPDNRVVLTFVPREGAEVPAA